MVELRITISKLKISRPYPHSLLKRVWNSYINGSWVKIHKHELYVTQHRFAASIYVTHTLSVAYLAFSFYYMELFNQQWTHWCIHFTKLHNINWSSFSAALRNARTACCLLCLLFLHYTVNTLPSSDCELYLAMNSMKHTLQETYYISTYF